MLQKPPLTARINLNHPQNKGLLASWNFREGNGSNIVQDAVAGNTVTRASANASWTTGNPSGISGWVGDFTSTTNYWTADRSIVYFDTNKKFTASIIAFPRTSGEAYPVMMNLVSTVAGQNFIFGWSAPGSYTGLWGGLGSSTGYRSNVAITTSTWYHFVLTYNGNGYATGTNFRCYYNGIYVGGETNPGNGGYSSNINTIGSPNRAYEGLISDVRLWERELEDREISRLYSNPYETFISPRKISLASIPPSGGFTYSATGGLEVSGESITNQTSIINYTASGLIEISGQALTDVESQYNYIGSGGNELGGESLTSVNLSYTSSGNVTLDGTALITSGLDEYHYTSSGILELSDEVQSRINLSYIATDGLELSGESNASIIITFAATSVGNLSLSGEAIAGIQSYKFTPTGSLSLGDSSLVSSPQFFFYYPTGSLNIGGRSNVSGTSASARRRTTSTSAVVEGPQLISNSIQGRVCKWRKTQGAFVPAVTNNG